MSVPTESAWLGDIAPPAALRGGRPAKGHVGRQRKVHCERCGFIAYASRGALQRSGLPRCGCGEQLQLANLRDRFAVEPDALESELVSYGRSAYDAAMRELGEPVEREHGGAYGHSGAVQHRCAEQHCDRFTSAVYCHEHEQYRPAYGAAHSGRAA
jgi:hypothetical protein